MDTSGILVETVVEKWLLTAIGRMTVVNGLWRQTLLFQPVRSYKQVDLADYFCI